MDRGGKIVPDNPWRQPSIVLAEFSWKNYFIEEKTGDVVQSPIRCRHRMQLLIIGDYGVGKTSLMLKYVNNTFNDAELPTISMDTMRKYEYFDAFDQLQPGINIEISDTTGQE